MLGNFLFLVGRERRLKVFNIVGLLLCCWLDELLGRLDRQVFSRTGSSRRETAFGLMYIGRTWGGCTRRRVHHSRFVLPVESAVSGDESSIVNT